MMGKEWQDVKYSFININFLVEPLSQLLTMLLGLMLKVDSIIIGI